MGVPATEEALDAKVKTMMAKGKKTLTLDDVKDIASDMMALKKSEKELSADFEKFAQNEGIPGMEGKITAVRLTNVMKYVGERMPERLVNSMIQDTAELTNSSGYIDFRGFSETLAASK